MAFYSYYLLLHYFGPLEAVNQRDTIYIGNRMRLDGSTNGPKSGEIARSRLVGVQPSVKAAGNILPRSAKVKKYYAFVYYAFGKRNSLAAID
jgi:hypothetical protein